MRLAHHGVGPDRYGLIPADLNVKLLFKWIMLNIWSLA